jgi:putative membrane protein
MKDRFFINGRTAVALAAMVLICLAGVAFAQNPSFIPRKPTASPTQAPAANANTNKKSQDTAKGGSLSSGDKSFMREAAKGGMMEVAMGRQAEQNASNPEVKRFGARMVTDHSKANSELKSIASKKGVELPGAKEPGRWKSDKDYMDAMVKDHEKDLADFEKEAKNGSDPEVKQFAEKTSTVVRKHLNLAKEIQGKLK